MNKFSAWIEWYRGISTLKRLFIWSLVLGLLVICIFLNSNKYWPFYDGRFETYRVPIKIGDRIFAFPRNYLWAYKQADEGKKNGHIEVRLLMPGYEPMTRENYNRFKKVGEEISFILDFYDKTEALDSSVFHGLTKSHVQTAISFSCGSNYQTYLIKSPKYSLYKCGDTKTFLNREQGFLFQCDERKPPYRSTCMNRGNNNVYGNIIFSLFFDAKYGPQSDKIYAYIKNLIETAKAEGEK